MNGLLCVNAEETKNRKKLRIANKITRDGMNKIHYNFLPVILFIPIRIYIFYSHANYISMV